MTIEQRLLSAYGKTDDPCMAQWMLSDGTLVNGSHEGRQRDIDHLCIGEYFKRSKFEQPGSGYIYIKKFMNRGNIRMNCNEFGFGVEFTVVPTQKQFDRICRIMDLSIIHGIKTYVERHGVNGQRRGGDFSAFLRYVERYTDLSIPDKYYMDGTL